MRITADTNLLLRILLEDVSDQAAAARALLDRADLIAVPVPVLCELSWTLRRLYRRPAADVALAIETILGTVGLVTDRPTVEAGLSVLTSGGDFADGVIAFQGQQMGAETFASFDREAVDIWTAKGGDALIPAPPADEEQI